MCMEKKREAEFDIAKGILILCVVIGHGGSDAVLSGSDPMKKK